MTTNTPPELQIFVDCFNLCYPRWEIDGDATQDLQPSHVNYDDSLYSKWGKCGPRQNGRVYYRLNRDWWEEHDVNERLALIIHELAHIKHTDHSPAFWELVIDNYFDLADNPTEVTEICAEDVEWDAVVRAIVDDPHSGLVDNRKEIAYERRLKLADELQYPIDQIEPFSSMRILRRVQNTSSFEKVPVEDLDFTRFPPEELVDYFHARPRPRLTKERQKYVLDPPLAEQNNDGTYTIIENDEVASLYLLSFANGEPDEITVEITD